MIDLQLVLTILLSILVLNLLILTFFVLSVLKDFRVTLGKLNKVLDDTSTIVHGIANPLTILTGLVSAFSNAINTSKAITSLREDR
jgi:uncharacterized protein YoxC